MIAGASTRAVAFSALRGGFHPHCIDRYGDADLRAVAPVTVVPEYPDGVVAAIRRLPPAPVMYCGALENAGTVLDALESTGLLLGNPRSVVRGVRDPESLVQTFRDFNLPHLDVCAMSDPPPRDGEWLVKPLASGAGRGILVWGPNTPVPAEPHYYQRRAMGDSYGAVFIAPPDQRDVRFVGITRQLVGDRRLGGGPFAWCGSVGPETLGVEIEQLVRRIGNILSWKLGLVGLFGFDFVVDPEGLPRVVEVNPRYTGSTEILEHTLRLSLVRDHCAVFGVDPPSHGDDPVGVPAMGRFILYSDRDFQAPDPIDWLLPDEWVHADMWRHVPRLADIPCAGASIRRGGPICSLYITATTLSDCLEGVDERVAALRARLGLGEPLENAGGRA